MTNDIFLANCLHLQTYEGINMNPTPKVENNKSKTIQDILDLMKLHKAYNMEELCKKAPDRMLPLLSYPNLHSMIDNCRVFIQASSENTDIRVRFADATPDTRKIDKILKTQEVDTMIFDMAFDNWVFQKHQKKNTPCIQGPSNTGKSYFIRPLLELFKWVSE